MFGISPSRAATRPLLGSLLLALMLVALLAVSAWAAGMITIDPTSGPESSGIPSARVNPPDGQFEGGPSLAGVPSAGLVTVFNYPAGLSGGTPSGVAYSTSVNSGGSWQYGGLVPGGSDVLLEDPSIYYDWNANRFMMATTAFNNNQFPIAVTTGNYSNGSFLWGDTTETWSGIPANDVALNPKITGDWNASSPFKGNVYVVWDYAQTNGKASVKLSTSTNGGQSWAPPVAVSTPGCQGLGGSPVVRPNGSLVVVYDCYDKGTFTVDGSSSTDGGATFSAPTTIGSYSLGGTQRNCGTPANPYLVNVLKSDIRVTDFPSAAVDKTTGNVYVAFDAHGPGSDTSDVYFAKSTDGGTTWSTVKSLFSNPNDQFFPVVDVLPKGTVGVKWYDRRLDPSNTKMAVFGTYSKNGGATFDEPLRISSVFSPGQYNPQFYSQASNCFSGLGIGTDYAGSGAYIAWTDDRDPGPAGNNGVDPNIYFAHVLVPTAISISVHTGVAKITVKGSVTPSDAHGKVTVTLAREQRGHFVTLSTKTATLMSANAYTTSFDRPHGGTCQARSRYLGDDVHATSTKSITFSC